jgi:hypothetical protein
VKRKSQDYKEIEQKSQGRKTKNCSRKSMQLALKNSLGSYTVTQDEPSKERTIIEAKVISRRNMEKSNNIREKKN